MAYIRSIKSTFFTSDDIVTLSPLARLLYIALWTEADREGRMTWRPGNFKLRFLPGDACDINELCGELGASLLTQRRLGTLVNELDAMGLLNARIVNMGRYGRTKKIRLEIAKSLIKDVFRSDCRLGQLVDYELKLSKVTK